MLTFCTADVASSCSAVMIACVQDTVPVPVLFGMLLFALPSGAADAPVCLHVCDELLKVIVQAAEGAEGAMGMLGMLPGVLGKLPSMYKAATGAWQQMALMMVAFSLTTLSLNK